jgi:hypothetical protein
MSQNLLAATQLNPQVLTSTQIASASTETAVYTCPANESTVIATAWLCNTTGSAVTVNVSVVPSGGTAGATNRVVNAYPLAGGDTLSLTPYLGGAKFGPGDFVSVNVGTAAAVNFGATGTVGS